MPEPAPDQNLHLPSLVIKNFRGIDELTIPRLGRVTLLAGKNGVGKTTVLDAVRIYAAGADPFTLAEILHDHDEVFKDIGADANDETTADWSGLFYGHNLSLDASISIGSPDCKTTVEIRCAQFSAEDLSGFARSESDFFVEDERWGLETIAWGFRRIFRLHDIVIPTRLTRRANRIPFLAPDFACVKLGPDVPDNSAIERYLNDIALTTQEDQAIDALNTVASLPIERVAMVESGVRNGPRAGRRVLVKVKGWDNRLPLRSLGDGAVRAFAVALALANSQDGFLLIDEVENGIHHSIQAKFWNMVLQTAERNNVQVIATTHSWDCVVGFAQAANKLQDVEGVLYRIQRNGERLRAVEYPESELANAAEHRIEVR